MKLVRFFKNVACGAAIGIGMILPGVSGGTIAVILKIYDKLIAALGDLRKDFKANFGFLFSVLLGAAIGFAAMYFPLKLALERAALPTYLLFAGLMVGSLPNLFNDSRKFGFKKLNIFSVTIPFVAIIGICVLNLFVSAGNADLSANMPTWGYFAVFGVAMLASCALVIPGVSGSMLLMILGYYAPVFGLIGGLLTDFLHCTIVLAIFTAGLLIGFFSVAKLMKYLLARLPRGTHWSIIGFVLASIPALFIVLDYSSTLLSTAHITVGCILFALGAIATFALTAYAEGKMKSTENKTE